MGNVFRKILGGLVFVGSIFVAVILVVGGFIWDCIWFLVCLISGGERR